MPINDDLWDEPTQQSDPMSLLIPMTGGKAGTTMFRDDIIEQLKTVLISEKKPCCLLVGACGTGKTHIVEEFAARIKEGGNSIPSGLQGYKVYALSLSSIVCGCGLVGMLEKKISGLIEYLEKENSRVILFIDEFHMLFQGESYKKIAQILKPALARGSIKVIGATTVQEAKLVDEDPAFSRRFTRILVDELSKEQTCKVLEGALDRLSKHYKVNIKAKGGDLDSLTSLIVDTADEFRVSGSHRPDNALTLLDRALGCAIVKAGRRKRTITLSKELLEETAFKMITGNSEVKHFDEISFARAAAHLKGQEEIVSDITRVLKLYDMHVRPQVRPLTFLFAGSSGVGKTELTKIIAENYIGEKPIILNMTEYNNPSAINRIMGAPAGYAGYNSSRELVFDALETNPYQVILLDEFEKSCLEVQRLFMSVLDEGVLQTNTGKTIDFSKAIVIATTNAGCTDRTGAIGFNADDCSTNLTVSDLAEYFDIELINRFAHRYTFREIKKDVYSDIIREAYKREVGALQLDRLGISKAECFPEKLSDDSLRKIVADSYQPQLGARPALAAVTMYIDKRS